MKEDIYEFVSKCQNPMSVRTVAKRLGLKRRYVSRYMNSSGDFRKVDPFEVGSGKTTVNCFVAVL